MTPEQQRIAIAEACGWTFIERLALTGIPKGSRGNADARVIPDYLNDLNAMNEVEQNLGGMDKAEFAVQLCRVVGKDWPSGIGGGSFAHVHATAAQRAEAFLRTLNLYTP
jgi:hypothetical protein